jgi:hypothetical protein
MASDWAAKKNPACKIGNEARGKDPFANETTPGPAFYDKKTFIEENKANKKGYSCRQKTADLIALELSRYPAPGQYESNMKNKPTAPRCSTSQTKRKTFMDDN